MSFRFASFFIEWEIPKYNSRFLTLYNATNNKIEIEWFKGDLYFKGKFLKVRLRGASNLVIAFYITQGIEDTIFKGTSIQGDVGFQLTKVEEL